MKMINSLGTLLLTLSLVVSGCGLRLASENDGETTPPTPATSSGGATTAPAPETAAAVIERLTRRDAEREVELTRLRAEAQRTFERATAAAAAGQPLAPAAPVVARRRAPAAPTAPVAAPAAEPAVAEPAPVAPIAPPRPGVVFYAPRTGVIGHVGFEGPAPWDSDGAFVGRSVVAISVNAPMAVQIVVDGQIVCTTLDGVNFAQIALRGRQSACVSAPIPDANRTIRVLMNGANTRHRVVIRAWDYDSYTGIGDPAGTYSRPIVPSRDLTGVIAVNQYMFH